VLSQRFVRSLFSCVAASLLLFTVFSRIPIADAGASFANRAADSERKKLVKVFLGRRGFGVRGDSFLTSKKSLLNCISALI